MFKIDDGSVAGVECVNCHSVPTKGEYAIDTEVLAVDPRRPQLGARHQIVCQKCAEALVELVPNKAFDRAKAEVKTWKAKYGELVAALDTFSKEHLHVSD